MKKPTRLLKAPSLQIVYRAVDGLHASERNARTHPPAQIDALARAFKEFGVNQPVAIAREGKNKTALWRILAGHGRIEAARKVWAEAGAIPNCSVGEIPTVDLTHLSAAQRRAYILADNKIAERAGWDIDVLRLAIGELKGEGFDLGLLGFELPELRGLLLARGADPEVTPPVPAVPVSKLGDLYVLGDHRLLCGDSTSPEAVARLLGEAKPHLMVTDPPYGVEYDAEWRNKAARNSPGMGNRNGAIGKVLNDDRADWSEAWALFTGDVAYVWHGALHAAEVAQSLTAAGFQIRSQIIWAKQQLVIGRGDYHWKHEPCWYAVRRKGHWNGDRQQTTLWEIDKPQASETGHSTQKPIECMRRPIMNNSKAGDAVYDPFLGSGTTLIACEMEARCCYGIELNPAYCDVIVKRWEDFTGKRAVRQRNGRERKAAA